MKYLAATASVLILTVYALLAQAAENFTLPDAGDRTLSVLPEEQNLLIPNLDGVSGKNNNADLWRRGSDRHTGSHKYEPTSHGKNQAGGAFGSTTSKSPTAESTADESWAFLWIVGGGAAGAAVALAIGKWRRVKRRRNRAPLPALLVATLSESQPAIAQPRKTREKSEVETRRAA